MFDIFYCFCIICLTIVLVAVNKSAANAASAEGFSSHDQVGCLRSLPDELKIRQKLLNKLSNSTWLAVL